MLSNQVLLELAPHVEEQYFQVQRVRWRWQAFDCSLHTLECQQEHLVEVSQQLVLLRCYKMLHSLGDKEKYGQDNSGSTQNITGHMHAHTHAHTHTHITLRSKIYDMVQINKLSAQKYSDQNSNRKS